MREVTMKEFYDHIGPLNIILTNAKVEDHHYCTVAKMVYGKTIGKIDVFHAGHPQSRGTGRTKNVYYLTD